MRSFLPRLFLLGTLAFLFSLVAVQTPLPAPAASPEIQTSRLWSPAPLVDAVLTEAIPSQASHTGGMLIIAVRSFYKAGISIGLHGVETMEDHLGRAPKEAVIEPGMSLEAIVTADVKLQPWSQ
jgi:hypothetical protein